jgi:hypothetical protein
LCTISKTYSKQLVGFHEEDGEDISGTATAVNFSLSDKIHTCQVRSLNFSKTGHMDIFRFIWSTSGPWLSKRACYQPIHRWAYTTQSIALDAPIDTVNEQRAQVKALYLHLSQVLRCHARSLHIVETHHRSFMFVTPNSNHKYGRSEIGSESMCRRATKAWRKYPQASLKSSCREGIRQIQRSSLRFSIQDTAGGTCLVSDSWQGIQFNGLLPLESLYNIIDLHRSRIIPSIFILCPTTILDFEEWCRGDGVLVDRELSLKV